MKTSGFVRTLMSLGIAAIAATVLVAPAFAQDAGTDNSALPTKPVTVTVNQAPVKTVLETLFKSVGASYSFDQGVGGDITVSLNNIAFDVALKQVLRAANPPLTFSIQDGVYNVKPKAADTVASATGGTTTPAATSPDATTASTDVTTTTNKLVKKVQVNFADAVALMTDVLGGGATVPVLTLSTGGGMGGGMGGGFGNNNGNNNGFGNNNGNNNGFGSSNGFGNNNNSSGGFRSF
jgi:hypothetical protein